MNRPLLVSTLLISSIASASPTYKDALRNIPWKTGSALLLGSGGLHWYNTQYIIKHEGGNILCMHALQGDVDKIEDLLALGIPIDAKNTNNETALAAAIKKLILIRELWPNRNTENLVKCISFLLTHGASVNAFCYIWKSPTSMPILSYAIHCHVVTEKDLIPQLLATPGIKVNAPWRVPKARPLYCAVEAQSLKLVQRLLDAGARVDYHALNCADKLGNKEIFLLLRSTAQQRRWFHRNA